MLCVVEMVIGLSLYVIAVPVDDLDGNQTMTFHAGGQGTHHVFLSYAEYAKLHCRIKVECYNEVFLSCMEL